MKSHFLKKICLVIYILFFIVVNAQHTGIGNQQQESNNIGSSNLGQALGYNYDYDALKGNWMGGGTTHAGWDFTVTIKIFGQVPIGQAVANVFYPSHEGCEGELRRSQEVIATALVLEDFGVVSSNCQPTKMYLSYEYPIMIIDYYNPHSGEYLYQAKLQRQ